MEVINNASAVKREEIDRPLADFPVNIWEDPLTSFSVSDPESERNKEKLKSLKETVKDSFMASKEKPIENIKFIDALCRSGSPITFSKSHLEGLASRSSPHLAVRIKNALKHAYPRGISRIETRQYISYYEKEDSHDQTLLEFAKVDFNLLQMMYREEIGQVFRWYKNLNLDLKVPYARNRTVESHFWAVGTQFEPCYSQARIFEHKRKHVGTSIDCYMKQYGISWEKAKEDVKVMALDSWKNLNEELMTKPHQFLFPIVTRFLNFSRVVEVFYKDTDIFTHPELMKDYVVSLFLDNIPI